MGLGITLVILGIGSFLLPMLGAQFKIVKLAEALGAAQPALGIILLLVGVIFIVKAARE